ncbi:MAG: AI-2E family transporter [Chloroflexota bacterium]|nr:AI-2E family transporter [Chloroflexota bacterium]
MSGIDDELTRGKRERWWRSAFLIVATVYVALLLIALIVRILGGFTQILLIVFIAWLLAFVLAPLVGVIVDRRWMPRGVAIGVVYAATLLGSGFLLFYAASSIGASTGELAADFPQTRTRIEDTLRGWEGAISFGRFQPDLIGLYRDAEATGVRLAASALGEVPGVTFAVLGALVLVIILSLYMLADSAGILAKVNRVVPTRYADHVEILERTVAKAFGGFLRAQVILAAVQTALTIVVVLVAGLPYAFLIAAASALAMLIPFFGPPLALVPPVVATAIFEPQLLLIVAPLLLIVQTVVVNYLQPRLMHEALGMHPILVLIGLLVGAQVAGLWGALFGIPILAVLNVFFNYAVNLRSIEETPAVEVDEVLDEVRRESPDATPEEVVAIAADRVEEDQVEEAAEEVIEAAADGTTQHLREAAGDLRAAAGEQRAAASEIGSSASDLRGAVDRLGQGRPEDDR